MKVSIDPDEVLNQLSVEDIVEYLISNYSSFEIINNINFDILENYLWTSMNEELPFNTAIVYCIYNTSEGITDVIQAKYIDNQFIDNHGNVVNNIVKWAYKPNFA